MKCEQNNDLLERESYANIVTKVTRRCKTWTALLINIIWQNVDQTTKHIDAKLDTQQLNHILQRKLPPFDAQFQEQRKRNKQLNKYDSKHILQTSIA